MLVQVGVLLAITSSSSTFLQRKDEYESRLYLNSIYECTNSYLHVCTAFHLDTVWRRRPFEIGFEKWPTLLFFDWISHRSKIKQTMKWIILYFEGLTFNKILMLRNWARICKRLRSPGIDTGRLHRLAESIPWNRFLGSLNVYKFGLWSF
jgi:hypothetical protein